MPTSSGAPVRYGGHNSYEKLLIKRPVSTTTKISTPTHRSTISYKSTLHTTGRGSYPHSSNDYQSRNPRARIDVNDSSFSSVKSTGNDYRSPPLYSSITRSYPHAKAAPNIVSTSKLSDSASRSDSVASSSRSWSSIVSQNQNSSCSTHDADVPATSGSSSHEKGNVGLTNLGNTCFMNSMLQCMLNTRMLIEYVRNSQMKSDINRTMSSMKGALVEEFAKLVSKVWDDGRFSSVAPRELRSKVVSFAPKFSGYSQQDSQEFLRYFLQGLHEDVNRVKSKPKYIGHDEAAEQKMTDSEKAREYWRRYINFDNSAIVDLFVGQLKSELICQTCNYKSVTFDPFWDLSLPIPKGRSRVDIQDCMEYFMKEEILDGDERPTCAKCKTRRRCTKTFQIQRFPKILVLHLKRFSGDRYRQKLQTKVNFELQGLNLSRFSVSSDKSVIYNIYGISNHIGSVYSGHYTAYCKHPYSRTWHLFDDSRVSSITERSLVSEEAYVLFYEMGN